LDEKAIHEMQALFRAVFSMKPTSRAMVTSRIQVESV